MQLITKRQITPYSQRGTGMVEVMVAAVIIGIGLLGIAALQGSAMQASTGAALRAKAVDFAATMADRIRTNQIADNCYCRDTTTPVPCRGGVAPPCAMDMKSNPTKVYPAAKTMADNDLAEIDAAVAAELPNGTMTITCSDRDGSSAAPDSDPCSEGSTMFITISWSTQTDTIGQGTADSITLPFVSPRPLVPEQ